MLLRFTFSNFLSYKDETVISFEATKGNRIPKHVILEGKKRLLKGVVCFGANASGKSNLIRAIDFSRKIILSNFKFNKTPNCFKINNKKMDTCFKYEFVIDDQILIYEVKLDLKSKTVLVEKLYSDKPNCIFFERINNGDKIDILTSYKKFSKDEKKAFEVYREDYFLNKDNHLNSVFFLNDVASKRASEIGYFKFFKDIYGSIKRIITIYPNTGYDYFSLFEGNEIEEFKNLLSDYKIDISDFIEERVSIDSFIDGLVDSERDKITNAIGELSVGKTLRFVDNRGDLLSILKNDNSAEVIKISIKHGSNDLFSFYEESDGTRRLFDLLPLLLMESDESVIVLIDEIDRSLHTLLTKKLINDLFSCIKIEKVQFLITSHDINLLDQELLRADEIMFVNKDDYNHVSSIIKFNECKRRPDRDFVRDYLNNRFGGVPKI